MAKQDFEEHIIRTHPRRLYHITTRDRVANVMAYGIKPQASFVSTHSKRPSSHFIPTLEQAYAIMNDIAEAHSNKPLAIIKVYPPRGVAFLKHDPYLEEFPQIWTYQTIPASCLHLVGDVSGLST